MVSGAAQDTDATPEVSARPDPAEPDELRLAAEFAPAARDEWLGLVDEVLRRSGRIGADAPLGAGFQKLVRRTPDGIAVQPLYTAADIPDPATGLPGGGPLVRGATRRGPVPDGWDVRQRHVHPDPGTVRSAVLADLENGVTSIWLVVGGGGTAVADLPAALDGVLPDLATVVLDAGAEAEQAAEAFLQLAAERGVPADRLLGTLGLDPI